MKRRKRSLAFPLIITFVLMAIVVIYTSDMVYRISVANIYEVGEDKCAGIAAHLENYLETAKSVLWVTADTVDDMTKNGDDNDRILEFLEAETANQAERFDENYTGIYGVVRGEYLDGAGWVPPEDYDPYSRDWYKDAIMANGKTTIVSPYVDAQTGSVIISICRMLPGGKDALSLDVAMNYIQSYMEDVTLKEKGLGFLVNRDGTIIAHHNNALAGMDYKEIDETGVFMKTLIDNPNGNFKTMVDGEKCTAFTHAVMDQWYVVVIVKDSDMLEDVYSQLKLNIIVSLICYLMIALFYLISYRNELSYSKNMEEMAIREQRKEFEARILKLEKTAADSANQAKSTFLAEMSHEIRTPINAVLGMNEMILRESKEENTIEYAKNVKSAGRTLLSIINSILDFSKIEDGKMEIMNAPYDTASMIHDLVNSISERIAEKSLDLKVEVDENLPSGLIGDDVRVSQIIMNLLTNAVKYTKEGQVEFSVKNGGMKEDKVILDVSVKDTGVGIKKKDMGKLFASFERIEEDKNRHIEGTGLGMAIVTKLLAMMDSDLKVESVYGEGSEFSFKLSQGISDATPIGDYAKRLKYSKKDDQDETFLYAPNARVLVVDDNEMNLKVVKNLLKKNGIVPELVLSGAEAIEKIRDNFYDVVFLDHMMPEMDGIKTLEKLRSEGIIKEGMKIIALTANAVVGAKENYLSAGFDDYMSKPIEAPVMEGKLKKYLPESAYSDEKPEKDEEEILEFAPDEETTYKKEISFSDIREELEKLGLDTKAGLNYCAGDEDFYIEMLSDYSETEESKLNEIIRYKKENDLKEYKTRVHALKSTSKTIGADELFNLAKILEEAAAADDAETIDKHHDELAAKYKDMAVKLKELL